MPRRPLIHDQVENLTLFYTEYFTKTIELVFIVDMLVALKSMTNLLMKTFRFLSSLKITSKITKYKITIKTSAFVKNFDEILNESNNNQIFQNISVFYDMQQNIIIGIFWRTVVIKFA